MSGVTEWNIRCVDFTALQSAYLKLYINSFGNEYNKQLSAHIPLAFAPNFNVHAKKDWKHLANRFEPFYTSLRNWMFTEVSNLIDFSPYRPLVAESEVRKKILVPDSNGRSKRRVLVDIGANGFFASPKFLLDSYFPYLPFTHAIMVEPGKRYYFILLLFSWINPYNPTICRFFRAPF
jgi:hypothetical protein